ncbi:MAG TPA: hypothetical protein VJ890_13245 [Vineibacter sp.]|nr:hypothetical protein [Vineibacter sp.]
MTIATRLSVAALASAVAITGLAAPLAAQSTNSDPSRVGTPYIDGRQVHQDRRVYRGVQDGSLTPREYQWLERRDARIDAFEARAKADGVVTPRERARLDGVLDRQSAAIYRQRHDGQGTYAGGPGGTGTPGVDARERRQQDRIYAGARDGSLTAGEFRRLEAGQYRVHRYEARAKADGTVTPRERVRLDHMQDRQSRTIYLQRHDGQVAGRRR